MRRYSQREILEEGFWDLHKSPILKGLKAVGKGALGVAGAAVKGGAYLANTLTPELTAPLDKIEGGIRGFGQSLRKGWDVGSGGLMKEYGDILLDSGYLLDEDQGIQKTGKNRLVIAYRILGHDNKGNPRVDKEKPLTMMFDKNAYFKIVSSSAQDTTNFGQNDDGPHPSVTPHKK